MKGCLSTLSSATSDYYVFLFFEDISRLVIELKWPHKLELFGFCPYPNRSKTLSNMFFLKVFRGMAEIVYMGERVRTLERGFHRYRIQWSRRVFIF